LEKAMGCFLLKNLWNTNRWWNIWDDTPIKSPLATTIKSIDAQNVTFFYKITEAAVAKKK
jgi:hypothetical protein